MIAEFRRAAAPGVSRILFDSPRDAA